MSFRRSIRGELIHNQENGVGRLLVQQAGIPDSRRSRLRYYNLDNDDALIIAVNVSGLDRVQASDFISTVVGQVLKKGIELDPSPPIIAVYRMSAMRTRYGRNQSKGWLPSLAFNIFKNLWRAHNIELILGRTYFIQGDYQGKVDEHVKAGSSLRSAMKINERRIVGDSKLLEEYNELASARAADPDAWIDIDEFIARKNKMSSRYDPSKVSRDSQDNDFS